MRGFRADIEESTLRDLYEYAVFRHRVTKVPKLLVDVGQPYKARPAK